MTDNAPLPAMGELVEIVRCRDHSPYDDWGALTTFSRWGRSRGLQYHMHALFHPANVTSILTAGTIGIVTGRVWLFAAALLIDAVAILALTRRDWYRRAVDAGLNRSDRAGNARRLRYLLDAVSDAHRARFHELGSLFAEIQRRTGDGVAMSFIEEHLEPDRVLASYLKLALVYRQWEEAQAIVDRGRLTSAIEEIERQRRNRRSSRALVVMEQREVVVRKRVEHWDRMAERLEVVGQQLMAIEEAVRLLHAHSVTAADPEECSEELDAMLQDLARVEPTIRELFKLERMLQERRGWSGKLRSRQDPTFELTSGS